MSRGVVRINFLQCTCRRHKFLICPSLIVTPSKLQCAASRPPG